MRKLTSKLALLVLAVALAVVALGTTTFAWFTLGGTAETTAVDVNVTSSTGLEISYDGINYKNTLAMLDFTNAATAINGGGTFASDTTNNYSSTLKMQDVTSADGKTFYFQNGDSFLYYGADNQKGGVDDVTTKVLTLTNDAAKKYLQFDIWVRKTGSAKTALTATIASAAAGTSWLADATIATSVTSPVDLTSYTGQTIAANTTYNVAAAKAARISITSNTSSPETKIGETTTGTATGAYNTSANSANAGATLNYIDNLALAYDKVKGFSYSVKLPGGADHLSDVSDYALPTTTVTASSTTTNAYTIKMYTGSASDSLPANTPAGETSVTRYTVRVWLEGFDADCFNSILNGALSVALKFETVE